jgi:hypothetical protein
MQAGNTPRDIMVTSDDRAIVEVTSTEADTEKLVMALEELGATITGCFSLVQGRCSAMINIADLPRVAASASVQWIGANFFRTHVGSVESEASQATFADDARRAFNVNGTGVKVCVLSDSFDKAELDAEFCPITTRAADDVALGDLPPFEKMDIVQDHNGTDTSRVGDEGRAMMQVIHDVAPGAELAFYTGTLGLAAFAQSIKDLVDKHGCNVLIDDIGQPAAAMFQDDLASQAVDYAHAQGVPYFSAAGNQARQSLEVTYTESSAGVYGENNTMIFDDGNGGTVPFLRVSCF